MSYLANSFKISWKMTTPLWTIFVMISLRQYLMLQQRVFLEAVGKSLNHFGLQNSTLQSKLGDKPGMQYKKIPLLKIGKITTSAQPK